jgi:predicted Zn finger-like uncharacterized protein
MGARRRAPKSFGKREIAEAAVLTQCPKCETIYRLSASDLGSAEGFVQCGECAEQFNTLHRLADEPSFAKPTENGVAIEAATTQAPGPAFILMDTGDETIEPVAR